ncbi:MAG TPA: helix-turn-helix domain-containing protein [Candidatus Limnocylindria bacterium]|nr:helix-turn-helix domain-containing protein [Candidatus Limnocylindria bacterium]
MPTRTRQHRAAPESPALKQLGQRLREARTAAGLSQGQLGAPYYTRAHVSAIELGKIRPAMKSLEHMAAKLGKPASYFMEDAASERNRREIAFDIDRVVALASRPTAADCIRAADELLESNELSTRQRCRVHWARGRALNLAERSTEAPRDLTIAQRLVDQIGDAGLARAIEYEIAAAARGSGDSRRARELFQTLLRTLERNKDRDRLLRVRVLQALGAVSVDLGEPQAASGYLTSALEWAQDVGELSALFAIYYALAVSHRAQGDLEAATTALQRALATSEVAKDVAATAIVHNMLAVIAADGGRLKVAYEHADRAIELGRMAGPIVYVAHYLNTKAECAAKLGDWTTAESVARESFALGSREGSPEAVAAARVALSQVLEHRGDGAAASAELHEAAEIYRGLGAKSELADVLMRLSRAAKTRNDLVEAERFATLAFEATRSVSALMEVKK